MSIIKCPECGKEISNQASSCPNCGYSLSNETQENNNAKSQASKKPSGSCGCLIIIIAFALIGWLLNSLLNLFGYESDYEKALKSGMDKFYNGENLNDLEEKAVEDYIEWFDKKYH